MSETVNLPDKLPRNARPSGEPLEQSFGRQPDSLSACLEAIDTPAGRERLQAVLAQQPYPHFQAVPGRPNLLQRIDADGSRTVGQFVNRQFRASTA
jgi:hypothetical protein